MAPKRAIENAKAFRSFTIVGDYGQRAFPLVLSWRFDGLKIVGSKRAARAIPDKERWRRLARTKTAKRVAARISPDIPQMTKAP